MSTSQKQQQQQEEEQQQEHVSASSRLVSAPPLIPNTILFSPSGWISDNSSGTDNQQKVDEIFAHQENNEFGDERFALLFLPGTYDLHITVGYYTSIVGLGITPDEVTITGNVEVKNRGSGSAPGALDNFWRSVSNLHVVPKGGNMFWRVSQASPIRSLHVDGNLFFAQDPGWSSGGYCGDTLVSGSGLALGQTQQQWVNRNMKFSQFEEVNWNAVCIGCDGVTGGNKKCGSGGLYSDIKNTPLIASSPYLFFDNSTNSYSVMVPPVYSNVSGPLPWGEGNSIDLSTGFYIASPSVDTAASINSALEKGAHLLLTPGIYVLSDALRISKAGTIVLGLGLATLTPSEGNACLVVSDEAIGVRLSSFMAQAGSQMSDVLLRIGQHPHGFPLASSSEKTPTILSDIFGRVGGPRNAQSADTMLEINQDWVVTDNIWLWRADHSSSQSGGLGPTNAVVNHALRVEGDHVYCYGLMTEHVLKELVLWNGNDGKIFFLQSELAYDVSDEWDYPCVRIDDDVTSFEGVGMGVYSFFNKKWNVNGPSVSSAIVTPGKDNKDVIIRSAFTIFLNGDVGRGEIRHVVNGIGNVSDQSDADQPQWASWNCDECPIH